MGEREERIARIQRLQRIENIRKMQQAPKEIPTSPLESAAQGAAQGASLGFADELMGMAGSLMTPNNKGSTEQVLNSYQTMRDKQRQDVAKAQKDNPMTYGAGMLGGTMASNMIPGMGIARGAKAATSIAKATGQGLAAGIGENVNPDELGEDALKGAALGGVGQTVIGGLGKMASAFTPSALKGFAERRAVKAATGQNVAALRKAANISKEGGNLADAEGKIQRMGRDILDEGALDAFDSVRDLSPKLGAARQKYGQEIGDIGTKIDELAPKSVDGKKMSEALLEYAAKIAPSGPGEKLQNALMKEASRFEKTGQMGFEDAQAFKDTFKYKATDPSSILGNQDVTNKVRQVIGQGQEDAAGALTSRPGLEGLLDQYKNAKKKYGSFAGSEAAATGRAVSDLSNRFVSPSDYAAGATAAATSAMAGDPSAIKGAIAMAANKISRERGSSVAALTADRLAKTLDKSPEFVKEFGQVVLDAMNRGPAALTATHHVLMKDPKYRANFEGEKAE